MKISEFIKHQAVSLTELLHQYGDIPVVAWNFEGRYLSETAPLQAVVSYETYTSQDSLSFTDDKCEHVCIVSEVPNPLDHIHRELLIVEQQRLIKRQHDISQDLYDLVLLMDDEIRTRSGGMTSFYKANLEKRVKDCIDEHTNLGSVKQKLGATSEPKIEG